MPFPLTLPVTTTGFVVVFLGATFTDDGTQLTPIITPVLTGSAGFEGNQESLCCLTPGTVFAVQLDGGSPGDEGQYIIEYIQEIEANSTYVSPE